MIDELRNCVFQVQRDAGGSLEAILGMRNSLQAAREAASDPSERPLLNAAYMVLTVAIGREFETQSAIAPVSKLVSTHTLTSRVDHLLQTFVEWADGSSQKSESVVDALLEIHEGLSPNDPLDSETGLLLAAALLIAGESRHRLDQ